MFEQRSWIVYEWSEGRGVVKNEPDIYRKIYCTNFCNIRRIKRVLLYCFF